MQSASRFNCTSSQLADTHTVFVMRRLPGLKKHSVDIIILLTRLTRAALSAKGSPGLREARLLVALVRLLKYSRFVGS